MEMSNGGSVRQMLNASHQSLCSVFKDVWMEQQDEHTDSAIVVLQQHHVGARIMGLKGEGGY